MIPMTDRQLHDFCTLLDWEAGYRLPDGRVLGNPAKRGASIEPHDYRIEFLRKLDPGRRRSILEMGCAEGYHTVQLASLFAQVTAVEVRPKNVTGTLVNLFIHEIRNVRLLLGDVRDLGPSLGVFDVLFHSGVLYHLMDPIEHLHRVGRLADAMLLETHYCVDGTSLARSDITFEGRSYRAHVWPEGGWGEAWSGVEPASRWLHRDALMQVVRDVGFTDVEVLADYDTQFGPRLGLWAQRPRAAGGPPA